MWECEWDEWMIANVAWVRDWLICAWIPNVNNDHEIKETFSINQSMATGNIYILVIYYVICSDYSIGWCLLSDQHGISYVPLNINNKHSYNSNNKKHTYYNNNSCNNNNHSNYHPALRHSNFTHNNNIHLHNQAVWCLALLNRRCNSVRFVWSP